MDIGTEDSIVIVASELLIDDLGSPARHLNTPHLASLEFPRFDTVSDMDSVLVVTQVAGLPDVAPQGVEQNMSGRFERFPSVTDDGVVDMIPLPGFDHDG